jgi:CRISPR-associated exonuclease Cas4
MVEDEDLLPLSALQHIVFCERQFALIHVEQQWAENSYTAEGRQLHGRAHEGKKERRPGGTKEFGMPIRSLELGLTGMTDAVEYAQDGSICIVEYKRGRPKRHRADEIQVCAQAMCMEEMLGKPLAEAQLFYGKVKRRKAVALDAELRDLTRKAATRAHELLRLGSTPKAGFDAKRCPRCSLLDICIPGKTAGERSVERYLLKMTKDED